MLERKVVTVLFADLVGSTQLAAGLDPEDLREAMSRYHEAVSDAITDHGGTLEKFIGDAVLAVFGYPSTHEDDPARALRAAFAVRDAVAGLEQGLEVRVGVTTGEVVADPSADARGDLLVTGDVLHPAQRLQAAAAPGEILVGTRTIADAPGVVDAEQVGDLQLRGLPDVRAAYKAVALRSVERLGVVVEPTFVGRASELALLRLLYHRVVTERRSHLVTVVGPAGIGKTRLVQEFVRTMRQEAAPPTIRGGTCKPYGEATVLCPIQPLVFDELPPEVEEQVLEPSAFLDLVTEAMRRLHADCGLPDDRCERIARVVTWIWRRDHELEPAADRDEVLGVWRVPLEARARLGAVLAVFDNLQWAGDEPLDFVESLPAKLGERPVLVLAASRPELLERRTSWSGGRGDSSVLSLRGIADEDSAQLIGEILRGDVDPELMRVVSERAQGNPYFVAELTRNLAETGQVEESAGAWRLDPSKGEPKLPDSVYAAVAATIDRLPPDEKLTLLLGAYAAYHRLFYDEPVRRMPHAEGIDIAAALTGLVERGLISEETPYTLGAWGIVPGTGAFTFATVLMREVAHDMVPIRERAVLHLTFADWLQEVTQALPDTACLVGQIEASHLFEAWHLRAGRGEADAELGRRALGACLKAAEAGVQVEAWREATVDLQRAAAIAEDVAPERMAEIAAQLETVAPRAAALDAAGAFRD